MSATSDRQQQSRGPGLAKARRPPLMLERTLHVASGSDARWRDAFEHADVVSEGAATGVHPDRRYYGSTSIVLPLAHERDGDDLARIAALVERDPHVKLRALRTARREAAQRAAGPLETLLAEVNVRSITGGVALQIEVEARVLPDRRTDGGKRSRRDRSADRDATSGEGFVERRQPFSPTPHS